MNIRTNDAFGSCLLNASVRLKIFPATSYLGSVFRNISRGTGRGGGGRKRRKSNLNKVFCTVVMVKHERRVLIETSRINFVRK